MAHTMTDSLENDVASILGAELTALGYPPANAIPWRERYCQRFNLKKRMVEARPRAIHAAQGIVVPAGLQAGYDMVVTKLQNGTDVRPYLSTRLARINFRDEMLNDWGILHFHLGTVVQGNGFVDRTGDLLFARIEPDHAYLLGVGNHAHFSNQVLVQALVDNWPDAMARFEQPNILDVWSGATDAEIKELRTIGGTIPVRAASGKFYMGLGGGGMTLGRWPIGAAMGANRVMKMIRSVRSHTKSQLEKIATDLEAAGHAVPDNLNFSLRKDGNSLVLSETSTNADITTLKAI